MVSQYPYDLFVFAHGDVSVQDENLAFTQAENNDWVFFSKCRDEQNSNSNVTYSASGDGVQYTYNYLIQLPKGCKDLQIGDKVQILDCEKNVRCEGNIQMFKKDQFHSRAWV